MQFIVRYEIVRRWECTVEAATLEEAKRLVEASSNTDLPGHSPTATSGQFRRVVDVVAFPPSTAEQEETPAT